MSNRRLTPLQRALRKRKKCPKCGSGNIATKYSESIKVCEACGANWTLAPE